MSCAAKSNTKSSKADFPAVYSTNYRNKIMTLSPTSIAYTTGKFLNALLLRHMMRIVTRLLDDGNPQDHVGAICIRRD